MNSLKLVLLASVRFALVGVLKATLFGPDSPFVSIASQDDSRTRVVASTAVQEAGVAPTSLGRDAFSS
jgi:hypothetical protein